MCRMVQEWYGEAVLVEHRHAVFAWSEAWAAPAWYAFSLVEVHPIFPDPSYVSHMRVHVERGDLLTDVALRIDEVSQATPRLRQLQAQAVAKKAHRAFETARMARFKRLTPLPVYCGAFAWWSMPLLADWSREYNRRRGKVVREALAAQYGVVLDAPAAHESESVAPATVTPVFGVIDTIERTPEGVAP